MNRILLFLILILAQSTTLKNTTVLKNTTMIAGGSATPTFTFIGSGSCNASAITCGATYSPAAGNLVIADVECRDGTASQNPSLTTDNGSSTWANGLTGGQQSGSYYNNEDYTLSAAGSPTTITANCGAAALSVILIVTEYHRTSGSWVFGAATSNAFGSSTTATSPSVTPTASVPALVHGYFMNTNNTTSTFSTANSTVRLNKAATDTSWLIASGDQIISSASGSYTASATISLTSDWQAWAIWYK